MRQQDRKGIALVSSTVAPLPRKEDPIHLERQRLAELELENSHLKQAISELAMEKLLLKVALETSYRANANHEPELCKSVQSLNYDGLRTARQVAEQASAFAAPEVLGKHLCEGYGRVIEAPIPDEMAELIEQLAKTTSRSSRKSLVERVLRLARFSV
jgi:hypothetical protein